MTTTPVHDRDPVRSYPLSWTAVDEATAAVDAAPRAEEVELWVHDAREAVAQIVPSTGRITAAAGGAFGAACRVWEDGAFGSASRTVDGADDVRSLVQEARTTLGRRNVAVRPAPGPAAAPAPAPRRIPAPLDTAAAEHLVRTTAERLRLAGADVQVLLAQQYQWTTATATLGGLRREHHHEQTRVVVRCETAHGAVVEAAEAQRVTDDPGTDALVHRIATALDTLGSPGLPGPAAVPRGLPVVLRPQVAAPVVAGLSWLFSGSTALATPGLARAVGKRLFPSCLHVDDVPHAHPDGPPMVHDDEGVAAGPVVLADEGRLAGFLHSWDTAHRLGHAPNGRGIRMGVGAQPMPRPVALRVAPGRGAMPEDFVELSCRLENLVTMPRAGRIEMIVAGWEVRGGRRIRRIAPFEFHCDLLTYLRKLRGTGTDAQILPLADGALTPSLHFEELP
ncbi:hypothetical protein KPP03845_100422 [Streptomyces xanthophaeus]|uniref:metallopeptidase TldD-related protein n=1 Tax=Streptomyces xanthophaeus TaxID=67385 RepID=UPI00233E9FC2|nr:metallopeptidase TldD-related protein [Streptomyces xanthophaeus]WCD84102.1 hypothetical protein KPP03845_100422 [Streptomyces xanthophaeus]